MRRFLDSGRAGAPGKTRLIDAARPIWQEMRYEAEGQSDPPVSEIHEQQTLFLHRGCSPDRFLPGDIRRTSRHRVFARSDRYRYRSRMVRNLQFGAARHRLEWLCGWRWN